jgi:thioredoxin reductase (NADPH)
VAGAFLRARVSCAPDVVLRTRTQIEDLQGGADPNTSWLGGCLVLDEKRLVKTGADLLPEDLASGRWPSPRRPYLMEASIPAVFCVGDARSTSVKRVASAVGEGSICIPLVHRALAEL